jgi:hypothetical protein
VRCPFSIATANEEHRSNPSSTMPFKNSSIVTSSGKPSKCRTTLVCPVFTLATAGMTDEDSVARQCPDCHGKARQCLHVHGRWRCTTASTKSRVQAKALTCYYRRASFVRPSAEPGSSV